MSDAKKLRELELKSEADRHLSSEVKPDRARDILLSAIKDTPSGKFYIETGRGKPLVADLVAEVWVTDTGGTMREILNDSDAEKKEAEESERARQMDEIREIENPAARVAAYRKAGGTK